MVLIYEPVEPNLTQESYQDYRERAWHLQREPMDFAAYVKAAVRWNREYRNAWKAYSKDFGYTPQWSLICELEEMMCV